MTWYGKREICRLDGQFFFYFQILYFLLTTLTAGFEPMGLLLVSLIFLVTVNFFSLVNDELQMPKDRSNGGMTCRCL